jgi:hypothetical protein
MIPTFALGQLGLGRTLTPPVTSYANAGGTGNRTALITITKNITQDGGADSSIVDGTTGGVNGWDMPGTGATAIPNGAFFDAQFATRKFFTKTRLRFASTPSMGAWDVHVHNGGALTLVGSLTWNASSVEATLTGLDPEGYTNIRCVKNGAGSSYTNDWFNEWEFEIADGAT